MLFRINARCWTWIKDISLVLGPCRFSLFVVLAGGTLLLAVPQGRELSVRLADDGISKILLFYLAVFVWAFESWYWARFTLDSSTFGIERRLSKEIHARSTRIEWWINHLPRIIAFLAYGLAILASLVSGIGFGRYSVIWIGLGLLPQGILFYLALVKRREIYGKRIKLLFPKVSKMLLERSSAAAEGVRSLAPLSRWIFKTSLIFSLLFTIWAGVDPVGLGNFFGSSAIVFLGFSMIVPFGSLAVYWGRNGGISPQEDDTTHQRLPVWGYPVVTSLVLLALVFSLWLDNHEVRKLDTHSANQQSTLANAVDEWLKQAPKNIDGTRNLVVVATAGGGIRAAYWTATVLGALQDQVPSFRKQLLGISGVSGGSLGATVFTTLLSEDHITVRPCPSEHSRSDPSVEWSRGPYECAGQTVLSQDFLAPTIASALSTDLIQRFFPIAILPDRARALEQAWEQAWPEAGFEKNLWSSHGFDGLWKKGKYVPSLLLNGTEVTTGRRIITSNLVIRAQEFPDSYDFFQMDPGRIRPSTAVLNSARFTYVSPAGKLGKDGGRIVDGGYFENFGADTARDFLRAALEYLQGKDVKVNPIIILISNDQNLEGVPMNAAVCTPPANNQLHNKGSSWGGEILSPIRALLATRNSRGVLATINLCLLVKKNNGQFFHFRLYKENNTSEPALGWVLSTESENTMRQQLRTACRNKEEFSMLLSRLKGE